MRSILATILLLALVPATARSENLDEAWGIALTVNGRLRAQQQESLAAGHSVAAARAARGPQVSNITINTLITPSPSFASVGPSPSGSNTMGTGGGNQGNGNSNTGGIGLGSFGFFGQGQADVPVSNTSIVQPIYTGGRLRNNVNAASADLNAQRAEEYREAMDLKLTVAEAYVDVLRASKGLAVADSNVARLKSFVEDTRNRREEGLATRNDQLSAEVSLANARQSQIRAQRLVASAWATYNRYLCRPLTMIVPLDEIMVAPASGDLDDLTTQALRSNPDLSGASETEIRSMTEHALQTRPELASLTEQARSLGYQAEAARSGTRPQVTANVGHTLLGFSALNNQNYLTSALFVNWTIGDSGATRRRVAALRHQESAAMSRRADTAAAISLEIRTRWLELAETRRQIPVAREAIEQAEENIRVVLDRYRQGLSTYTQVLDAESLRIQSLTSYYDAAYDGVLAAFRLRRAVGDL
jgi:outer membrane protein TolC